LLIKLLVILNLVQLILQISQFFSATSQTQVSSSSMVASAVLISQFFSATSQTQISSSSMVASTVLILTFALAGFCGFVNKQMGVISSGTYYQQTFCILFLG
jgi:hypothetical protein